MEGRKRGLKRYSFEELYSLYLEAKSVRSLARSIGVDAYQLGRILKENCESLLSDSAAGRYRSTYKGLSLSQEAEYRSAMLRDCVEIKENKNAQIN